MEVYNLFNFRALYALIVDFFEAPCGQEAQRRSQKLLKWWSTYVISPHFSSSDFNFLFYIFQADFSSSSWRSH